MTSIYINLRGFFPKFTYLYLSLCTSNITLFVGTERLELQIHKNTMSLMMLCLLGFREMLVCVKTL